jgi:hypothetical protein
MLPSFSWSHGHPYSKLLSKITIVGVYRGADVKIQFWVWWFLRHTWSIIEFGDRQVLTSETEIGSCVAPEGRARVVNLRTRRSTCMSVVSAGILASGVACAKPRPGDRVGVHQNLQPYNKLRNQLRRWVRDEYACRSGSFHLLHVGYTGKDLSFLVWVKHFPVYVTYESRQRLEIHTDQFVSLASRFWHVQVI